MTAPRRGWHIPATDEDTIDLIRSLAERYDDTEIARILSRQGRKTVTGLDFTRGRVNALRQSPGHQNLRDTHRPGGRRGEAAEPHRGAPGARRLRRTIYRWLRAGFITGTQLTPGGPSHLRVDAELRAKIVPDLPPGWVGLKEAAQALGVARQTVLDRVRRGELRALEVTRGRRRGLAIEVGTDQQPGQLFVPETEEAAAGDG